MLKVAIVGCGKIADAHASQIVRIAGAEIVGVCDREPLMARQLAERFPVKAAYDDLATLLAEARPDVVHITTPPASHFDIASLCLEHGSHVYVEKPFTLYAHEAADADRPGGREGPQGDGRPRRPVHACGQAHARPGAGRLSRGPPLHMESYYCYDLSQPGYAKALLSDKSHWVRRLPGGLLQNIISHGIARIAEFLVTESPTVIAHGFVSPLLRSMGERETWSTS